MGSRSGGLVQPETPSQWLKFVNPEQHHLGQDVELQQKRNALYALARQKSPNRWSGKTRNWSLATEVHLNPDKAEVNASNQQQK